MRSRIGRVTNDVIVNLTGVVPNYVTGRNYNHLGQAFASGVIPILGENAGDTLASLRTTRGALTGYQVNIINANFQGESNGQNSDGVFPLNFNYDEWTAVVSAGVSVAFKITGLNNALVYTLKIMCSAHSGIAGNHLIDITVAGASGGGTTTGFDEKGNVNNIINGVSGWSVVPLAGEITITVTKNLSNTGIANVSGFDLSY